MSDYEDDDFDSDTAPATPRAAPPATREEQAMAMYKSAFNQKLLPTMKTTTTTTTTKRSQHPHPTKSKSMPTLPQDHHQQTPRASYGSNTVATQTNDTWLPELIQKIVSQRVREEKNRREMEINIKNRSKNQEKEDKENEEKVREHDDDNHDLDGLVIESDGTRQQTKQQVISATQQHQHCMPPSLSHHKTFESPSLDEFLSSSPFPFHHQSNNNNNSSMTPSSVISVARQHRLERLNSSVYRRSKRGRNSGGRKSGGRKSGGSGTNQKLSERNKIKKLLKNIRRIVNQNREGSIEIFHQCEARSGGGSGTLGLLDLRSCLKKLHLQCTIDECKRIVKAMRTRVRYAAFLFFHISQ